MSREIGAEAERRAREFLQKEGFEIVEQNLYSRFGEIDIIALRGEVLHFIEVKSGKNFNPIYAITPKKLEKIKKTIGFYLMQNAIDRDYCISVVCMQGEEITFLENINF